MKIDNLRGELNNVPPSLGNANTMPDTPVQRQDFNIVGRGAAAAGTASQSQRDASYVSENFDIENFLQTDEDHP